MECLLCGPMLGTEHLGLFGIGLRTEQGSKEFLGIAEREHMMYREAVAQTEREVALQGAKPGIR